MAKTLKVAAIGLEPPNSRCLSVRCGGGGRLLENVGQVPRVCVCAFGCGCIGACVGV